MTDAVFEQVQLAELRRLLESGKDDPVLAPQLRERIADYERKIATRKAMRSTLDILLAVKESEPVTESELRLGLLALSAIGFFIKSELRSLIEAVEKGKDVTVRAQFARDTLERMFQSLKQPADEFLGGENIPGSHQYDLRYATDKKLTEYFFPTKAEKLMIDRRKIRDHLFALEAAIPTGKLQLICHAGSDVLRDVGDLVGVLTAHGDLDPVAAECLECCDRLEASGGKARAAMTDGSTNAGLDKFLDMLPTMIALVRSLFGV